MCRRNAACWYDCCHIEQRMLPTPWRYTPWCGQPPAQATATALLTRFRCRAHARRSALFARAVVVVQAWGCHAPAECPYLVANALSCPSSFLQPMPACQNACSSPASSVLFNARSTSSSFQV